MGDLPCEEASLMGTLSKPTIMGKPWFTARRSGESRSLHQQQDYICYHQDKKTDAFTKGKAKF